MSYAIPALSEGGWIFFSTRMLVILGTESGLLTRKAIISLVCLLYTRAGACFIAGDASRSTATWLGQARDRRLYTHGSR